LVWLERPGFAAESYRKSVLSHGLATGNVLKRTALEIPDPEELVFGRSKHPLEYGLGLKIGHGEVVPEIKYAPRPGTETSLERLRAEYVNMTNEILNRAINLGFPSIQLETEYIAQMTYTPSWGEEIVRVQRDILERFHKEYGIRCALRATIGDVRTAEDGLRDGKHHSEVIESFERAARHADLLSIESIGGKEVFNHALIRSDVKGIVFAVGILACLDMQFLWGEIASVARSAGVIAAGDTDCAHSNTAMQLAGGLLGKELPHSLAAFVRALGAARSLVAYEEGAVGPGKDCGFENIIVKAITGLPMSFEGKSSACADSTLMGNMAGAACDLWSNESVQQGELFGGTNPQVFTEILGYDCALMNAATKTGNQKVLRDVIVASDMYRDPQSLVLAPQSACRIGGAIVGEGDGYHARGLRAGEEALAILHEAQRNGLLKLPPLESKFLDGLIREVDDMPSEEAEFTDEMVQKYNDVGIGFSVRNYGL